MILPHKSKFALIEANPREHLVDREISWLAFNERVLQLAEDTDVPLLERCRYLAIFLATLMIFHDSSCNFKKKIRIRH